MLCHIGLYPGARQMLRQWNLYQHRAQLLVVRGTLRQDSALLVPRVSSAMDGVTCLSKDRVDHQRHVRFMALIPIITKIIKSDCLNKELFFKKAGQNFSKYA